MKVLAKAALAAAILAATYLAIVRIAEHKADSLAGGGAFRLDRPGSREGRAFEALLDQLRRWKDPELAASLLALQQDGRLFVAPHLAGERSAIYVSAVGMVKRIYVRRDELVDDRLPFPDLEVPDAAKRQFARIRLAGTLFHELQHYEGLEDEAATYGREIEWYRGCGRTCSPGSRASQRGGSSGRSTRRSRARRPRGRRRGRRRPLTRRGRGPGRRRVVLESGASSPTRREATGRPRARP